MRADFFCRSRVFRRQGSVQGEAPQGGGGAKAADGADALFVPPDEEENQNRPRRYLPFSGVSHSLIKQHTRNTFDRPFLPCTALSRLAPPARSRPLCAQGVRGCLGANLAKMNYTSTMAVLLSRFTFQLPDDVSCAARQRPAAPCRRRPSLTCPPGVRAVRAAADGHRPEAGALGVAPEHHHRAAAVEGQGVAHASHPAAHRLAARSTSRGSRQIFSSISSYFF